MLPLIIINIIDILMFQETWRLLQSMGPTTGAEEIVEEERASEDAVAEGLAGEEEAAVLLEVVKEDVLLSGAVEGDGPLSGVVREDDHLSEVVIEDGPLLEVAEEDTLLSKETRGLKGMKWVVINYVCVFLSGLVYFLINHFCLQCSFNRNVSGDSNSSVSVS